MSAVSAQIKDWIGARLFCEHRPELEVRVVAERGRTGM